MSDNLFRKAVVFTDIHWGLKNNSAEHNDDCWNFILWMTETALTWGADTCIFLGDWHHSRHNLHIRTMNYSLKAMEFLANKFKNFFFLPGNHDLFYKEKRDLNSIQWARNIKNVTMVNEITTIEDVSFCPWLVGDEHKEIKNIKSRYMFGHFELPHFIMNADVTMPDHGHGPKREDFKNQDLVFSGHFHKRQVKDNIVYIGNAFPHNFSDAGDTDRGIMLLEWGKDPEFLSWPDSPSYKHLKLSELLDNPGKHIANKTTARVDIDIPISFEEATLIKETMIEKFGARKIELLQTSNSIEEQEFNDEQEFKSVDEIVISGLQSYQSETIDSETLIKIYLGLKTD